VKKTSTNEVENNRVFALLCGKSGAGKTYALGTLPNEETLIIALDPGLLTLKGKNIDVWKIESVDDLGLAYQELKKGTKYKHVCIDSLTELSEMCFATLKPQFTRKENFALYDEFSTRMIALIKAFRDLVEYNVFVTTLIKDTDDGPVIDVAQKSLGNRLSAYFDFSFLVKAIQREGVTTRVLVSDNSVMDFLKSRSKAVDEYEEVNLTNILAKVFGENNNKEEKELS
jgi:hypothetical protein